MKTFISRIGGYKIIESDTGEIRWETHFGFGTIQEGRCFKKGTILFIGAGENRDRHGFLKGEFLDELDHYPVWNKTIYYCMGFDVFHSHGGKMVRREEMSLWNSQGSKDQQRSKGMISESSDIAYRLQKYQIHKTENQQILWKTSGGPYLGLSGACEIMEDILFIGSMHFETFDMNKREFLLHLERLPAWNGTRYFCPNLSLHNCKVETRIEGQRNETKSRLPEITAIAKKKSINKYKETTEFRFIKTGLLESIPEIIRRWAKKIVIHAISLLLLLGSWAFNCLLRLWKVLKTRYVKKKRFGR